MKYVNENGRSMVEMLGVLAIIGVLSVGGIAGYSKAMNKFKINKTTDQVTMLVANIRTLYSAQGNYAGLNNGTAVDYGVVPNDMIGEGDGDTQKLKNAFAGEVTITAVPARQGAAAGSPAASEAFIVAYDGLTEEACAAMLTGDWGSGQASGLIGIAGGGVKAEGGSGTKIADVIADATGVNAVFTDNVEKAVAIAANQTAGIIIAAPGGKTNVPVTVAQAITACSGGNSGNAVAWKYY